MYWHFRPDRFHDRCPDDACCAKLTFSFSRSRAARNASGPLDVSPINDILDKNSFTLEEILAQDEVLQEVKSLNAKLVDL